MQTDTLIIIIYIASWLIAGAIVAYRISRPKRNQG